MKRDSVSRPLTWLALISAVVLVAAACSDSAGPADDAPSLVPVQQAADQAHAQSGAQAARNEDATVVSGTGLRDGLPEYNFAAAVSNSYWYSRYTLGSLVMMSGLGVAFTPPMEAVMGMVAAVDRGPENGEHVVVPANPALLQAVFAGGSPRFVNASNGDPADLANFRWDPASFDLTLTPSAQAQTAIKEIEWAKFFNSPGWSGPPDNDFGAMDRFKGMVMYVGAKMQLNFALQNLRNDEGFFVAAARFDDATVTVTDDRVLPADQYQMLQALSDLRWLLQHADAYNGVYADPGALDAIGAATDSLFVKARTLRPEGIQALALGAQAATWYAAAADDAALQADALQWLRELGDQLIAAGPGGVLDNARASRGLFEASRVLGDAAYLEAALDRVGALIAAYHVDTGHFEGLTTIVDWEIGDILGALNSAMVNGGRALDRALVQQAYTGFFEATVNLGGLLQAVIPKELEASPFELERFRDDILFAYPGIPFPPAAGGPNGTAAVHAAELTFDEPTGRWRVSDSTFNTAGAMHTSNEMFWTFGIVNGFPSVEPLAVANVLPID